MDLKGTGILYLEAGEGKKAGLVSNLDGVRGVEGGLEEVEEDDFSLSF